MSRWRRYTITSFVGDIRSPTSLPVSKNYPLPFSVYRFLLYLSYIIKLVETFYVLRSCPDPSTCRDVVGRRKFGPRKNTKTLAVTEHPILTLRYQLGSLGEVRTSAPKMRDRCYFGVIKGLCGRTRVWRGTDRKWRGPGDDREVDRLRRLGRTVWVEFTTTELLVSSTSKR